MHRNRLLLPTLSLLIAPLALAEKPAEKAEATEQVSVFGAGTLDVPSAFKRVKAQSRIVEHEFQAKDGKGEDAKTARVTFMAAGGDVEANIKRWKGQFSGGDPDDQKTEDMKVGNWKVYIVDVAGSYMERVGGGPFAGGKTVKRDDYAMAGAILLHPEGRKYFVKMIGPSSVIKANRKSFVSMIKSIDK